jgi:hypothetical protein
LEKQLADYHKACLDAGEAAPCKAGSWVEQTEAEELVDKIAGNQDVPSVGGQGEASVWSGARGLGEGAKGNG